MFDKNNYSQDSINIVQFDITNLEIGKTYTFSSNIPITWFKISNARNGYGSVQYSNTNGFAKYTFTMSRNSNIASSATQYLYLGIKGLTFVDTISDLNNYNIQIEEGSSATEYEEYGAMPSPEFPSEINNTGDLITKDNCASYGNDACDNIGKYVVQVKATGKNILDISKLEVGAYSTGLTQSSNTFSFKRTGTKNTSSIFTKIKLEAGTYTISGNLTQSDGKNGGYGVYDLEKQEYLVNRSSSGIGTSTFTVPESKIYSLGFFCNYNSVEGTQVTYSNIQLEYGSSATTYELYREATTNIYLDEPLRKVGDYVDYIDYSNGKIVRNTNLKTFNGNEEWYQFGSNVALAKWDDGKTPSHGDNVITGIYSNLFRENKNAQTSANDNTFLTHNILNVDWIVINRNINVSDFKTLLANKNATFIYPLATPIEESISLPQIKTVEGTNYITVNNSTSASNLKITTEK